MDQITFRPLIYVAGKYRDSSRDLVKRNIQLAHDHGRRLMILGAMPITPHKITEDFDGVLPDSVFIEADLSALRACHFIYMLDNFTDSEGAKLEFRTADMWGMPTLFANMSDELLHKLIKEKADEINRSELGFYPAWGSSSVSI